VKRKNYEAPHWYVLHPVASSVLGPDILLSTFNLLHTHTKQRVKV